MNNTEALLWRGKAYSAATAWANSLVELKSRGGQHAYDVNSTAHFALQESLDQAVANWRPNAPQAATQSVPEDVLAWAQEWSADRYRGDSIVHRVAKWILSLGAAPSAVASAMRREARP